MIASRGICVFPGLISNFEVERPASVNALIQAGKQDRMIFVAMQKDLTADIPQQKDIYTTGTVCRIRQQLSTPGAGRVRVMLEGQYRAKALEMNLEGKCYFAVVEGLSNTKERVSAARKEALVRNCMSLYEEYLQETGNYTPEHMLGILAEPEAGYIADFIAHNVPLPLDEKQLLLEETRVSRRLEYLGKYLNSELDIMSIEKELNDAASEAMNRNNKEYYLREEMKIIRQELGEDATEDDFEEYRRKIKLLPASDEVKEKLLKEVSHLSRQPFGSSEAAVIRSYLDTCLELPWGRRTAETIDLNKARKTLDRDHYGLEKVKERIIEYLAVKQLSPEIKGGLICLVGPPGVGKTSISMSVAKATNRKLVRLSLGGVHDEAEIRGHRKTYIGSMPGRIINGIIQAGSCNPLMVLDEIDKLGNDYRGDPASALLEVLDGEQNSTFRDNFLEIPFDLSNVFFITTANTTDTIPKALLDRMEVIEVPSYTDEEKLKIAKKHLLPKQREKHGLKPNQLKINDAALQRLITCYTKESGVRVLEREIARICRKAAAGIANGEFDTLSVKKDNLSAVLGPEKIKPEEERLIDSVGLVRGLAYTESGGEVLDVEVAVCPGTGKLEITGNLGDVMKESVHAALTCIRTRAECLGIDTDFYKNCDIHIHFPEGAIPKDGPSAGVTACTAITSALTGIPVRHDIAMTGEITLRGRVLAIGGLREKTMAALRSGVKTVIIPKENEADLNEIDPLVREKLNFIFATTIDDVLDNALNTIPVREAMAISPRNHVRAVNDPAVVRS